jgi:acyl-CoA thioesterase-2
VPVTFAEMMDLAAHGPDTFVGIGPRYPWGSLYGGQIVAQSLRAAALTVDAAFRPHSIHAYFIRRGDHEAPIRFEVDRLRDGRSFCTRRVVARQAAGAIFSAEASFQVAEETHDVQTAEMPEIAPPGDNLDETWSTMFERRFVHGRGRGPRGRATAWLRMTEPIPDDPVLQACALAYLSDDVPTDAVMSMHPEVRFAPINDGNFDRTFMSASLDHAIWFHRTGRADEWALHDLTCHGYLSSRGLTVGHVFAPDGTHLASVTQEVLLRRLRS